ncbi:Probable transcriptional regulator%2C LysR family [Mycobacteroides abscessus]|nr:Probable transcriptional regulator%2C LysR family [Mycobacteroides abscessus]
MDVRRLRILREFADRGTVGEVADAMSLTPSAVSQQLKVLTREAGYRCCVRMAGVSRSPRPATRWCCAPMR